MDIWILVCNKHVYTYRIGRSDAIIQPYISHLIPNTHTPQPQIQRFGPGRILHESPEFDAIAAHAVARGLPLLVSNPDIVRPGGDNDPMPGLLGQAYERKGRGRGLE